MKMVEMNWKPEDRVLRQFGWLTFVAVPFLGWMFMHRPNPLALDPGQTKVMLTLLGIGLVIAIAGTVRPQSIKYLFIGLSLAALPIGMVVSELIMLLIYFVVFLPVAIVFKLIGRDALERKIDRNAKTYWQPKVLSGRPDSYFRQS